MTYFSRCFIVFLFCIGCLAIDHATRDLSYEDEEVRLLVGQQFPTQPIKFLEDEGEDSQKSDNAILAFYPKVFDFKEVPVGIPQLGVVRVDNRLKDDNLKLISISGNSVHFHSSFFADKVITPNGNTTFDIVFLSRVEGHVDSNLYIHTSKGLFKYHVRGVGLPNPYRLRPLVGARIPVNATYEPLITMHNPHENRIQVVEMFSSGSEFHLKLPEDSTEGEVEGIAWAIDPFQTKAVMKGSFCGKAEGNHTGYIKIRVNSTNTSSSDYLIVPVEVQVSSSPGIYSPQDSLDFGLLVRSDKPKTLSLFLINAQSNPVNVQSVAVKGEANSAVRIEFRPVTIEPDSSVSTVIALVTFDASLAHSPKQAHGFIEIHSECGQSVIVPFHSLFLEGELQYNASVLGFFVKSENVPPRNFSVLNTFSTAVAIYEITTSHPEIVEVHSLNDTHVIPPEMETVIFTIKVHRKEELCQLQHQIMFTVKSNVTNLRLPITCYNGNLELHTVEGEDIDFGRLELYAARTEYFSVDNSNPIEIRLKSWGSNSSWAKVELVGMQRGVKEQLSKIKDFDCLHKTLFLQPDFMAVFSVEIKRPSVEGSFYGESFVTTDHNQTLRVPFRFGVSKGSVHSDAVLFDKAFPGKISLEKLHLGSTFNHSVNLKLLRAHPPSSLWFTPATLQTQPEVLANRKTYVGKIHFDPRRFCGNECYAGFLPDSQMGREWLRGANLGWETGEIDWNIYSSLQDRFEEVRETTVSNMTLWLETTNGGGYKVSTQVSYSWPRLTPAKVYTFPLTAFGNDTILEIPVSNPSSSPLVVQAVLAGEYGPLWSQFVQGGNINGNTSEGPFVFSLEGISSSSSQVNGSLIFGQVQRQLIEDVLQIKDVPGVTFFLPPGSKFILRAKFKPISKDLVSTMLLLRNNLTGVETAWLKGRGGTGQLTVGHGSPGSKLMFELTEKLLHSCQSDTSNKYIPPQLTVRRTFIARNIGEIPLNIVVIQVAPQQTLTWLASLFGIKLGDPCEGFGFRILNCHPFVLQPNNTHSIDIAFTPDFTLSKVMRSLELVDSTGMTFNYSLVAMIPSDILGSCSEVLARPDWEPWLKYGTVGVVIFSVIVAILMSYCEATSTIGKAIMTTFRGFKTSADADTAEEIKEQTIKLDLKQVYDKVDNRFKKNQKEQLCKASSSNVATNSTNQSKSTDSSVNTSVRNRKKKNGNSQDSCGVPKSNSQPKTPTDVSAVVDLTPSSCSTPSTVQVTTKKEGKKKKNKRNSGNSGNNNSNLKPFAPKAPNFNAKVEEETSSTTTESSNPDELVLIPEKERKLSGKSLSTGSGSGNDEAGFCGVTTRNKKRKNGKVHQLKDADSAEQDRLQGFEEMKKRNSWKRKENGNNKGRGSISPKSELGMCDSPRARNSDGFTDWGIQPEASWQKPAKRNSGCEQGTTGNLNACNRSSPNIPLHKPMENRMPVSQGHGGRGRPGVIGQPRSVLANNPQMSLSSKPLQQQFAFTNGMVPKPQGNISLGYSTSGPSTANRQQKTPPARPQSNSAVSFEPRSDNGCDYWNYPRPLSPQSYPTSTFKTIKSNSTTRPLAEVEDPSKTSKQTLITAVQAQNASSSFVSQNGYPAPIRPACTSSNIGYMQGNTGQPQYSHAYGDQYFRFDNRMPQTVNNPSHMWSHNEYHQGNAFMMRQQNAGPAPPETEGGSFYARPTPTFGDIETWTLPPYLRDCYYNTEEVINNGNNMQWKPDPPPTDTRFDGLGGTYQNMKKDELPAVTTSGDLDPWGPTILQRFGWLTEMKSSSPSLDSMAVGSSRTRRESSRTPSASSPAEQTSLPDLANLSPADVAKSHRDVEAGLGFNPFTSDIWNYTPSNKE